MRAEYFNKMGTDEYKGYANFRNGVEGLPSVLRRRYDVDDMPIRGIRRSKIWIGIKIIAMNTASMLRIILNVNADKNSDITRSAQIELP
jgi:hypothetical protein